MLHRRKRAPALGETPGTREEPGNRNLVRVHGPGGRQAEPGGPGNWSPWHGRPCKAPSIPYMEGALSYCARAEYLCCTRHAGKSYQTPAIAPGSCGQQ